MPDSRVRRFLRDPLLVFLIIGAGVFALDRMAGGVFDPESRSILVTREQVIRLADLWSAQIGRLPTAAELDSLVEDHVREEVLVREAMRMGLDADDTIVRRRLAQKMSFLIEDTVVSELAAYFEENAERYGDAQRFTLRHVYVSPDRRGSDEEAARVAADILAQLRAEGGGAEPENTLWRRLGDPFMLRREYGRRTAGDLAELFGGAFVDGLATLPVGEWAGPVESAYGYHIVRLSARTDARAAVFEDVRRRVLEDARRDARDAANREAHERLRERYQVEIEELEFVSELEGGGTGTDEVGDEP
ncbi:MAG: peptidyl-prolyl cis-trans isomerase [Acidobacteria bacterium]|nr:peptidyl-prolyl cis-trans isomerase [Acidobacteriota bacterium]